MGRKMITVGALILAGTLAACRQAGPPESPSAAPEPLAAHEATAPAPSPAVATESAEAAAVPAIDFRTQVLPIVEACRPCHFEGGKMYEELPFDDPATLRALGERLFTRIKNEDDQAVLRAFFEQEPPLPLIKPAPER